ncbi:response regulator [Desulfothermus naphthae]
MDKILFVDDEKNILSYFRRKFHKKYKVLTSEDPIESLNIVKKNKDIAVVVSDMKMPNMDGITLLNHISKISPKTVRVLLTGYADLETAILAVNKGNVFRFLTKPCEDTLLEQVLSQCVKQYKLVIAERELLHGTLKGSINLLSDILSLTNPEAFGRGARIKRMVRWFAIYFKVKDVWKYELAALLSQIGCVTISSETLLKIYKGKKLTEEEIQLYEMHPGIGHSLLKNIPRLGDISRMILYQNKCYDGKGMPQDGIKGEDIPLGGRFLKVALDFDLLQNRGMSKAEVYKFMINQKGVYDPKVLKALEEFLGEEAKFEVKELYLKDILPGMIFGEEVKTNNGLLLLAKGHEANWTVLLKLKEFGKRFGIKEPIKVLIPIKSDVESEELDE